jgi:hypothetical protein
MLCQDFVMGLQRCNAFKSSAWLLVTVCNNNLLQAAARKQAMGWHGSSFCACDFYFCQMRSCSFDSLVWWLVSTSRKSFWL